MWLIRKLLLVLWTLALIVAAAGLYVIWSDRLARASALGYVSWFEQYNAETAGFFDPESYRQALWQKERDAINQRALDAHQKEQAKAAEDRANAPLYACYAAQMTIKGRIRNAGDAKFPSCLDYPGHVTTISPTSWVVHSWVEMPDPSGIYRQHGFEVSVEHDVAAKQYRAFVLSLR
jgi:hypothetical protein